MIIPFRDSPLRGQSLYRLVYARAVDVFLGEGARTVVFGDYLVAVMNIVDSYEY
jgi:hypothetical protein